MSAGFSPDDDLREAEMEAKDPVWQLLGWAPLPAPDGWFAARTLARCRLSDSAMMPSHGLTWRWSWRWALGTGLALCVALLALTRIENEEVATHQKNVQEAFEIVASMDDDSDNTPSSVPASWQDTSY